MKNKEHKLIGRVFSKYNAKWIDCHCDITIKGVHHRFYGYKNCICGKIHKVNNYNHSGKYQ